MTDSLLKSLRNGAFACAISGLALVAVQPAAAQDDDTAQTAEPTKGEQRLARLLEGRVAGEPQTCIRTMPNQRFTVIEGTAYVYGNGRTIYVQRTQNPEDIDRDDALVSRRFNATELCRLDVITTIDPFLGFFTGAVFFQDFVPYVRAGEDDG
jgi:hypothetical protein